MNGQSLFSFFDLLIFIVEYKSWHLTLEKCDVICEWPFTWMEREILHHSYTGCSRSCNRPELWSWYQTGRQSDLRRCSHWWTGCLTGWSLSHRPRCSSTLGSPLVWTVAALNPKSENLKYGSGGSKFTFLRITCKPASMLTLQTWAPHSFYWLPRVGFRILGGWVAYR